MKNVRYALACVAGALVLGLAPGGPGSLDLGVPSVAEAAEQQRSGRRKKPRSVPHITEAVYRRLSDAQELVDAQLWPEALETLTVMESRSRRYNGNEKGQIYNLLAYVNYELGNEIATIQAYEKVLEQVPDITEAVENATLQQLSKLYFQQATSLEGDRANAWYVKALDTMREWMTKVENPGPEAHFYLAQIYYQMKRFPDAIAELEMTVQLARERGMKVKESWWTMLQFLYYEEENWPKVIEILEILVKDYPKRVYWVNLASVYGEVDMTNEQIWTLEAADVAGFLDKDTDLRTLGGLLLQQEIPNRASKVLQRGFDDEIVDRSVRNLQTLGQAYQLAGDIDLAIPIFEEAGELAEDGETYDRLSALYLEKDEHAKCETAATNALDKGGLKRPLATEITLGICMFNLDKLSAARRLFVEVRRKARAERARIEERTASQWVTYIDSETRRRAELARG